MRPTSALPTAYQFPRARPSLRLGRVSVAWRAYTEAVRWILPLVFGVVAAGCKSSAPKDEHRGHEADLGDDPAMLALDGSFDDDIDDEDFDQPAVGPDPLALVNGVGDELELTGDGLPAIRADGRLIARAENRFGARGVDRRLALRLYDVERGEVAREIVILDHDDHERGKKRAPSRRALDAAVARANALLGESTWRALIEPLDVANDGWIKCRKGVQSFSLADMQVSYGEPRLIVRRGETLVYETIREGWVARPSKPPCETRGYIADAALDLPTGILWLELAYCGECGVAPRQVTLRLPSGDPPSPGP